MWSVSLYSNWFGLHLCRMVNGHRETNNQEQLYQEQEQDTLTNRQIRKPETSCQQIDAIYPDKTDLLSCRQAGNHLHRDAGRRLRQIRLVDLKNTDLSTCVFVFFQELLKYCTEERYRCELQEALDTMLELLKSVNDSMHQIAITGYQVPANQISK